MSELDPAYFTMKPKAYVRSRYRGAYILRHTVTSGCAVWGATIRIRKLTWESPTPVAAWMTAARALAQKPIAPSARAAWAAAARALDGEGR